MLAVAAWTAGKHGVLTNKVEQIWAKHTVLTKKMEQNGQKHCFKQKNRLKQKGSVLTKKRTWILLKDILRKGFMIV